MNKVTKKFAHELQAGDIAKIHGNWETVVSIADVDSDDPNDFQLSITTNHSNVIVDADDLFYVQIKD